MCESHIQCPPFITEGRKQENISVIIVLCQLSSALQFNIPRSLVCVFYVHQAASKRVIRIADEREIHVSFPNSLLHLKSEKNRDWVSQELYILTVPTIDLSTTVLAPHSISQRSDPWRRFTRQPIRIRTFPLNPESCQLNETERTIYIPKFADFRFDDDLAKPPQSP